MVPMVRACARWQECGADALKGEATTFDSIRAQREERRLADFEVLAWPGPVPPFVQLTATPTSVCRTFYSKTFGHGHGGSPPPEVCRAAAPRLMPGPPSPVYAKSAFRLEGSLVWRSSFQQECVR